MDSKNPVLIVRDKKAGGKERYVIDQDRITIGRDRSSYITLPSRSISRTHAEVTCEGEEFYVTDLNSSNGTFLNEQRLDPDEKNLIRSGDKIRIEIFEITFQPKGDEREKNIYENTDTDLLEIKMLKNVLRAVDKENAPSLEVTSSRQKGKRIVLDGNTQEIVIGRDSACELVIDDETISRKHAKVVKRWDLITLIDLKSKNGTYVGKERIHEKRLKDGDRILLGTISIHYRNPQDINLEAMAPKTEELPPEADEEGGAPPQREEVAMAVSREQARPPAAPPPPQFARSASPVRKKPLSTSEMFMILLGLAILVLALVGLAVLV